MSTIEGQLAFDDPALHQIDTTEPEPPGEGLTLTNSPTSSATGSLSVEVIRSSRRRKTAEARLRGSTIEVRIPARCSPEEEAEIVADFRQRYERARSTEAIDLERRARVLADRHRLPRPTSIRWVSNQTMRWGSCSPGEGTIRISDHLAPFPSWVIDYVIVHELAHLVEHGHTDAFWALVADYPLAERARGFLIAKGLDG